MEYSQDSDFLSEEDVTSSSPDSNEEIDSGELESFACTAVEDKSNKEEPAYSQEPLADDAWIEEYNREKQLIDERERKLQNQLNRVVELDTYWSGTNRMPNVLTGHSGLLFSELNYGVQVTWKSLQGHSC
ncbi:hypothetical protein ACROYT_G000797 [Oculina patagonica]